MQSPGEMVWEGSKGFGWNPWQGNMPLPGLLYTMWPRRLTRSCRWTRRGRPSDHSNQFVHVTSTRVSLANTAKAETDVRYEPRRSTFTASRARQEKQSETENWFIWKASFTPPHSPHCDLNAILVTAVIEFAKKHFAFSSHPFSLVFLSDVWEDWSHKYAHKYKLKYKGPFGATVTSVKVLTASYISQNGPLRTTFTSATWL